MRKKLGIVGAGLIAVGLSVFLGPMGSANAEEPVSEKEFMDHCHDNLDGESTSETEVEPEAGDVSHWTCTWSDPEGNEYLNECWTEHGDGGSIAHQNCSFPTEAAQEPDDESSPLDPEQQTLEGPQDAAEGDDDDSSEPAADIRPDDELELPSGDAVVEDDSPDDGENDSAPSDSFRPSRPDSAGPGEADAGVADGVSTSPGGSRPGAYSPETLSGPTEAVAR